MIIKSPFYVYIFVFFLIGASLTLPGTATAQSNRGSAASEADSGPIVSQRPPTREERFDWFVKSTVGPASLGGGVISAAWGTAFNKPEEYGPHWDGFAKRYGMRLTGVSTSNAIEAGLGSVWQEDPRYPRAEDGGWKSRLAQAAKFTVFANRGGTLAPAYARYAAIAGSNFLSNTWRADSESSVSSALTRTALGFAGRFAGNVFEEFWPDLRKKMFGRNKTG